MHTPEAARGRGIGRAMLAHLIGVARDRGIRCLSLKTGSQPAFAPARSLYARAGFTPCAPFSNYRPSPSSTFLTLSLDRPAPAAPPCRRETPLPARRRDPVQLPGRVPPALTVVHTSEGNHMPADEARSDVTRFAHVDAAGEAGPHHVGGLVMALHAGKAAPQEQGDRARASGRCCWGLAGSC